MDLYNSNIQSLQKNRSKLFEKLEQSKDSLLISDAPMEVESIEAKNNDKVIVIKKDSSEYRLNSLYNPEAEAYRWANQFKIQNYNTIISMFGLGNGVFARAIVNKMDSDDVLIIYEPSLVIFLHAMSHYDLTDIISNKQIFIVIEGLNDIEFHLTLLSSMHLTNLKSQIQCIHPRYDEIFAEKCVHFFKELKNSLTSTMVNINSTIALAEKYIYNTMKNLCFLKDSISLLDLKKYMDEDMLAIVVAAGPSVAEELENLKSAKGRAVIIAVDRILDYLLDNGIEPDFVITIDPMKQMKHFSSREEITIPLICYYESNHEILFRHKGQKIFCTSNTFIEEIYLKAKKEPPSLLPSGSVAIVAYSACIALGFKKIALVGQDLAFQEGASHAGGISDQLGEQYNLYVEGVDGKQVKSRYDWKEFILRYQDLIAYNTQTEVIDTKKKGAWIKGTISMSLEDALQRYGRSKESSDENSYKNHRFTLIELKIIKDYFDKQITTIKYINDKSKKAVRECENYLKAKYEYDDNQMGEIIKKLTRINTYVSKQKIYPLIDHSITAKAAQNLAEILVFSDDDKENIKSTFMKSQAVYKAVAETAEFVKINMEEAIAKL